MIEIAVNEAGIIFAEHAKAAVIVASWSWVEGHPVDF